MATTPFQIAATLNTAQGPGLPLGPTALQSAAGQFSNSAEGAPLTYLGSGTANLYLGTPPAAGINGFQLSVDLATPTTGTVLPVLVKLNGDSVGKEISPGGWMQYYSPNPTAGITSISIAWTSDVRVRFACFSG